MVQGRANSGDVLLFQTPSQRSDQRLLLLGRAGQLGRGNRHSGFWDRQLEVGLQQLPRRVPVPKVSQHLGGTRGCPIGSTRNTGCAQLNVYLDGVQVIRAGQSSTDYTIDELIRPVEVAAVEVYPAVSDVPAEFSTMGRCGAVVIWSK